MNLKSDIYTFQSQLRQRIISRYYKIFWGKSADFRPNEFNPKKILFVLTGLIGDSVMSTAAIKEARRIWPDALLTVLSRKHNHELLAACPFINEFLVCDADPLSFRKSAEIKALQQRLAAAKFDAAIILLGDQYAYLLAKAKIPVRVGVEGTLLAACLTHTYSIDSPRTWGVDERLNSIRCLSPVVRPSVPYLCIEQKAKESAQKKMADLKLDAVERYIVLHPFGSTTAQWWSIDNSIMLAQALTGIRVILVGKSYDLNGVRVEPSITDAGESPIINTLGILTLPELMAVIDEAEIVVSTDSGPFHIAGALKKTVVGLFRARRPEHANTYPTARVIFGQDDRCQQSCDWDRCITSPCRQMLNIEVADVVKMIDECIGSSGKLI